MDKVRILVANEPSAYRDVIAAAFRALRPAAEVRPVAPEVLDGEVVCRAPHLVICSALSEIVQTRAHAWVLLYPGGTAQVVTSLAGRRATTADITLEDLLALVDRLAPAP
ncbi:MAG: hypothetical protein M3Q65_25530 [Chloroflexota bacterium]|nr:hypothetical protein [Chloroflexota bacterium]